MTRSKSTTNAASSNVAEWRAKREANKNSQSIEAIEASRKGLLEALGLGLGLESGDEPNRLLGTPQLAGSPMSSRALLRVAGIPSRASSKTVETDDITPRQSSVGATSRPPEAFVTNLSALSSGWTEVSSVDSQQLHRNKPLPMIQVEEEADATAGNTTITSGRYPYSLISTDDAHDTPLVGYKKLIVNTSDEQQDDQPENDLFFRPHEASAPVELDTTADSRETGTELANSGQAIEWDGHSAGSVIVPTKEQVEGRARDVEGDNATSVLEPPKEALEGQASAWDGHGIAGILVPSKEELEGHRKDHTVRPIATAPAFLSPSKEPNSHSSSSSTVNVKRESPAKPIEKSRPTHLQLPSPTQSSGKDLSKESPSTISDTNRTDGSALEAVLEQGTAKHFEAATLRKVSVEEWAKRVNASFVPSKSGDTSPKGQRRIVAEESDSLPMSASTFHMMQSPLYEGLLPDTKPSKRARRLESPTTNDTGTTKTLQRQKSDVTSQGRTASLHRQASESTIRPLRPSRSENMASRYGKDEAKAAASTTHSAISTKRSYTTSEEAAVAKRTEKAAQDKKARERRRKKESAKHEAYARKKQEDPLLKARLALVGLTPKERSQGALVASDEENAAGMLGTANTTTEDGDRLKDASLEVNDVSRISFYTAQDQEASPVLGERSSLVNKDDRPVTSDAILGTNRRSARYSMASTASHGVPTSRPSSMGTLAMMKEVQFPQPPGRSGFGNVLDSGTRQDDGDSVDYVVTPRPRQSHYASVEGEEERKPDENPFLLIHGYKRPLSKGAVFHTEGHALERRPMIVCRDTTECDGGERLTVPEESLASFRQSQTALISDRMSILTHNSQTLDT